MTRIGVLALQGDFAAHAAALGRLGADVVEVRRSHELETLSAMVLPGGESTTLLNLMQDEPWFDALREFHSRGGSMLATCAGAILISRQVIGPEQPSVGLLDAVIERNAYGRQIDSFEVPLEVAGCDAQRKVAFIRAPRFRAVGPEVDVLAEWDGEPVLVRQGRILAATFHTELTEDGWLHRRLLALAGEPAHIETEVTARSVSAPLT